MTSRIALLFLLAATPTTLAQTPPNQSLTKPLAFDVISIKPNHTGSLSGSIRNTADGIQAENMPLSLFVVEDFISYRIIGAPGWLDSERYDVQLKVAASDLSAYQQLTPRDYQRMMHAAMEQRLNLKDHAETRDLPVYLLKPAKSGIKLKPATPAETYPNSTQWDNKTPAGRGLFLKHGANPGERRFLGQSADLSELAGQLSYMSDIERLVIDKTGLTGHYDFTLDWMMSTQGDSSGPSIFTALQEQLGLRLELSKAPVEVLVIDHIERPTAN